jgi:hypothetical protein
MMVDGIMDYISKINGLLINRSTHKPSRGKVFQGCIFELKNGLNDPDYHGRRTYES